MRPRPSACQENAVDIPRGPLQIRTCMLLRTTRFFTRFLNSVFRLVFLIFSGCLVWIVYIFATTPNAEKINSCFTTEMYGVKLCPQDKSYVHLRSISPHLQNAVIIAEDAGFYQHSGFDFAEIKMSFQQNLEEMEFARGGSTITQQLAKNAFLSGDKTPARKLREALLTVQLERLLSKRQILEKYLNIVEFGPDIYGVRAAARHYFKKTPAELNPLESTYLAMLLPNPKTNSQSYQRKKLTPFARSRVLDLLMKLKFYRRLDPVDYIWSRANIDAFPWFGLKFHEPAAAETELPLDPYSI